MRKILAVCAVLIVIAGSFLITYQGAAAADTVNVAPRAVATASSQNSSTEQTAAKAIDGTVGGWPGDHTKEWATVKGGAGSWIKLAWSSPVTVSRVVLHDRPNPSDQVLAATVTFSDGTKVSCGALANDGAGYSLDFPAKKVSWLTVTITKVSATSLNIGLSEIEVWGTATTTSTVSSTTTTTRPTTTTTQSTTTTTARTTTTTASTTTTLAGNVRQLTGAKGDGVSDDTAAIQAAINACSSGQTLVFPAKTFAVSSIRTKSGVNLQGTSGAWLKGQVYLDGSNLTIQDMKIGKTGVTFGASNAAEVSNVRLLRCTFVGGNGANYTSPVIELSGKARLIHDIVFDSCTIGKTTSYINNQVSLSSYSGATGRLWNVSFRNCAFQGSTRMGVEFCSYSQSSSALYNSPGVNITGCTFAATNSTAISLAYNKLYNGALAKNSSIVSGNRIADAGVTAPDTGKWGIECVNGYECQITNNVVGGTHVNYMLVLSSDGTQHNGNIVTGNTFDGTSSPVSGVQLQGKDNVFQNNVFKTRGKCVEMNRLVNAKFTGDTFARVNADGSISTTGRALDIAGASATFTNVIFKSRYSDMMYGWKAANHLTLTSCTWHHDQPDAYASGSFASYVNNNPQHSYFQ